MENRNGKGSGVEPGALDEALTGQSLLMGVRDGNGSDSAAQEVIGAGGSGDSTASTLANQTPEGTENAENGQSKTYGQGQQREEEITSEIQGPQEDVINGSDGSGGSIDEEDDDYLLSDENDMDDTAHDTRRMEYNATLLDHSEYLLGTLNHALDSLELDKSLVLQAQLSGILNNENQKITEKRLQVLEKLELLKGLFKKNFDPNFNVENKGKISVIGQLNRDIKDLEHRIDVLKNGPQQSSIRSMFGGTQKVKGVINRFPVEYNQARDKVLERQIEE